MVLILIGMGLGVDGAAAGAVCVMLWCLSVACFGAGEAGGPGVEWE